MRYLLDKRMEKELNFRRKYIYDIFHVSTKIINHKQFIELVGIPEDIIDVCFIVGHNILCTKLLWDTIILYKEYCNRKNLKRKI